MNQAKQYRKKPVVISALQFDGTNTEEVKAFCEAASVRTDIADTVVIKTLEGDMVASLGDFIIQGVKGEFYPCKPDIFEKTYDIV